MRSRSLDPQLLAARVCQETLKRPIVPTPVHSPDCICGLAGRPDNACDWQGTSFSCLARLDISDAAVAGHARTLHQCHP